MPRKINTYVPPEPVKKPSVYKGNVICKINDSGGNNVHFFHKETDRLIDCTRLMHFLIGLNDQILRKKRKSNNIPEVKKECEEEFSSEHGKEILDILENGRLRLHLLFEAKNGTEYEYNSLVALINYIKAKNGLTEAYAKKYVQGFPALAYLQAETRYALTRSMFEWSPEWYTRPANASDFRSQDSFSKEILAKEKQKDHQTALTRSLLIQAASEDQKREIKNILYKSSGALKNPPVFTFTGSELFDLGVIQRLFTDEAALGKQFEQNLAE